MMVEHQFGCNTCGNNQRYLVQVMFFVGVGEEGFQLLFNDIAKRRATVICANCGEVVGYLPFSNFVSFEG